MEQILTCADAEGGKGEGKLHPRGIRRGVLAQRRNKTKPVGGWKSVRSLLIEHGAALIAQARRPP